MNPLSTLINMRGFTMSNLRIVLNEDNDHYFKLSPDLMNETSLRAYIDRYAEIGIDTISFCTSGQRCSFRSNVLDAIWDPLDDGTKPDNLWARNSEALFNAGIDPYVIWLDQCRKRGIHAWISTRMNDMHHVHPSLRFRADRRWFHHPEWMRGPFRGPLLPNKDWKYYQDLTFDMAWNYAHPEVRELMYSLLVENTERYDAEAFELDFSRGFFLLTPGHSQEDAHFLTEMLREYKKHLKQLEERRGHEIKVAVRLPWTPQIALSWGFDARQWAAEKLIDVIVVAPFWASFQYYFHRDEWRATVGNDIELLPAVDEWVCPYPDSPITETTAEFLRGWCAVMAEQNVDAVYIFNFPYYLQDEYLKQEASKFREMASFGMNRILDSNAPRCSQIGYLDYPAEGVSPKSSFPIKLDGSPKTITLPFGRIPSGGKVTVKLAFAEPASQEALEVRLNGFLADNDGAVPIAALRTGDNEITLNGTAGIVVNLFLRWMPA